MENKMLEESEELQQLHAKLKAAYIARDRVLQMQSQTAAQDNSAEEERKLMSEMAARNARDQEREDREARERKERLWAARLETGLTFSFACAFALFWRVKFFRCLHFALVFSRTCFHFHVTSEKQMEANALARQREYEEFLAQKIEVDRVVAQMHAEDAKAKAAREEKQKESQAFIKQYLEERQRWKAEAKAKEAAEMAVIAEWNRKMEERLNALKATKAAKQGAQDEMFKRVSAEIEANRKAREEMEQLLMDLFVEENLAKAREAERQKELKKEAMRVEMTEANLKAKAYKAAQAAKEQQEEEAYRTKLMEKFAADEKLEQMSKQKRHEKQLQYRKTVDALVAERRAIYEREKEMEAQALAEQAQREIYAKVCVVLVLDYLDYIIGHPLLFSVDCPPIHLDCLFVYCASIIPADRRGPRATTLAVGARRHVARLFAAVGAQDQGRGRIGVWQGLCRHVWLWRRRLKLPTPRRVIPPRLYDCLSTNFLLLLLHPCHIILLILGVPFSDTRVCEDHSCAGRLAFRNINL